MYYGIKDIFLGRRMVYDQFCKKEFWVFKDINFDLYEGEIIGIVGENGFGKISLMCLIVGIYILEQGEILLC